jgi:hypothetical protein
VSAPSSNINLGGYIALYLLSTKILSLSKCEMMNNYDIFLQKQFLAEVFPIFFG